MEAFGREVGCKLTDKMQPVGRTWIPWRWAKHVSVLIAPSVGDVGVLQEKLAPFVTELNTHLAQILEEDPKEGGSVLSLAAACAKRWAGWLMTICMTYESICWPCPGIPGLTINMRLYFYLQNFMGKIPLLVHSNRKYYREGNFGKQFHQAGLTLIKPL